MYFKKDKLPDANKKYRLAFALEVAKKRRKA